MTDRLSGIGVFVEAAEAGSFSAAAERLALSRSAVAKTVGRLEARLGVRLFHRTTRAQALTEDGQAFLEHCLRGLAEIRAGEAMLDRGRRAVSGRLRVSLPVLFGRRCVAPILTGLAREHPGLELDLHFTDRLVDLVEDGIDLAIRNGPLEDASGLMARLVARQRMTIVASPDYLARRGTPADLAALADHDCLVYLRGGRVRGWLFPQPDGSDAVIRPAARLRFDDLEALADAAAAGLGLTWLPCWLVRDRVRAGTLAEVLTDRPATVFTSHAIWPRSPHTDLKLRLAVDRLAAQLPGAAEL
ncbi:LysR family transcriptional regulator (plasmid) [Tistrella mobilis]|uniref:LysR family transcriptional regulator n=1 Tax=Tistrella mobilis TaxID=171437 RepID=UPI00355895BB